MGRKKGIFMDYFVVTLEMGYHPKELLKRNKYNIHEEFEAI